MTKRAKTFVLKLYMRYSKEFIGNCIQMQVAYSLFVNIQTRIFSCVEVCISSVFLFANALVVIIIALSLTLGYLASTLFGHYGKGYKICYDKSGETQRE